MMKMSLQRNAFAAFALASLAPVTASASIKSADAAGRYAVMREDKDTGCMLTLDLRGSIRAGSFTRCGRCHTPPAAIPPAITANCSGVIVK